MIDVRTPKEVTAGVVKGAVNIPVDSLRQQNIYLKTKKFWFTAR
ncbi:hypothetical protein [Syntrophomonas erecta]